MAQSKSKNVIVGIASGTLSAARSRNYFLIQNKEPLGGNSIYVNYGEDAAIAGSASNGVVIGPTEVHDVGKYYGGHLNAISDVAPVNVTILEY